MKRLMASAVLMASLVLAAGCSGAAPTPQIIYVTPTPAPATPTPAPATPTPTPAATPLLILNATLPPPPLDPRLGKVAFGTHYNSTTLLIDKGSMTFSRTASQVCWSAVFSALPKHASIRKVIVKFGSGGTETMVWSQSHEISNAKFDLYANCEPFQAVVGYVKGTYILRFLDGVAVLSEGRFILK
jgi:hypothetical protein